MKLQEFLDQLKADDLDNFVVNHPRTKFIPESVCECPLAKLLKAKFRNIDVQATYVGVFCEGKYLEIPNEVANWIKQFDKQCYGHRENGIYGKQLIESIERGRFHDGL